MMRDWQQMTYADFGYSNQYAARSSSGGITRADIAALRAHARKEKAKRLREESPIPRSRTTAAQLRGVMSEVAGDLDAALDALRAGKGDPLAHIEALAHRLRGGAA